MGGDTGGGEALRDAFGDVDRRETGTRESKTWGVSLLVRGPLVDKIGLLGIGPEYACLLFLLRSNELCFSNCANERLVAGGGRGMDELLVFSCFSGRSGEDCRNFVVFLLRLAELDCGPELLVLEDEIFDRVGVGNTYV